MKDSLIEGIVKIQDNISMKAFVYFQTNDFTPDQQTIPIMRSVVRVAFEKGAL